MFDGFRAALKFRIKLQ